MTNMALQLSDIVVPLNFRIAKGLQNFNIAELCDAKYNVEIDFDVYLPSINKNLQREFVWTLQQKQELILSLIKGIAIPCISIIQHKKADGNIIYKVIDGKQRLSTLVKFYLNHFPITVKGVDYYYSDFSIELQRKIKLYTPITDIAYEYWDKPISDEQKIAWFEMINFAGTPQDIEHLNSLKA